MSAFDLRSRVTLRHYYAGLGGDKGYLYFKLSIFSQGDSFL